MTTDSPILQQTAQRISAHLDEIAGYFKPGVHVTLLVRRPDKPTQDFMLTSEAPDSADEIVAMIRRRFGSKQAPASDEGASPGESMVQLVARAIAKGCGLDPDAPSAKAAESGHTIPEWIFFVAAASEAISVAMPAAFEMLGEAVKDATCQCEECIDLLVRKLVDEWK